MIIASHVIFTMYGFWLPNDPRGSWSAFVGAWELFRFGPATKIIDRRSTAHMEHDHELRIEAKAALKYPPVEINGTQAVAVARGFSKAIAERGYVMHACSILPSHVHAVVARHERDAQGIVAHLKFAATREVTKRGLHPFQSQPSQDSTVPTMWTKRCWKVFLDRPEDVAHAIHYVEQNPIKEGKREQRWPFVTKTSALA